MQQAIGGWYAGFPVYFRAWMAGRWASTQIGMEENDV